MEEEEEEGEDEEGDVEEKEEEEEEEEENRRRKREKMKKGKWKRNRKRKKKRRKIGGERGRREEEEEEEIEPRVSYFMLSQIELLISYYLHAFPTKNWLYILRYIVSVRLSACNNSGPNGLLRNLILKIVLKLVDMFQFFVNI